MSLVTQRLGYRLRLPWVYHLTAWRLGWLRQTNHSILFSRDPSSLNNPLASTSFIAQYPSPPSFPTHSTSFSPQHPLSHYFSRPPRTTTSLRDKMPQSNTNPTILPPPSPQPDDPCKSSPTLPQDSSNWRPRSHRQIIHAYTYGLAGP